MIEQPTKLFPCDCMGEGLTIVAHRDNWYDENDIEGAPFIDISFWNFGSSYSNGSLSFWGRLKYIWHIFKTGNPWKDMICMRSNIAKDFANHIFYLLEKEDEQPTTKTDL